MKPKDVILSRVGCTILVGTPIVIVSTFLQKAVVLYSWSLSLYKVTRMMYEQTLHSRWPKPEVVVVLLLIVGKHTLETSTSGSPTCGISQGKLCGPYMNVKLYTPTCIRAYSDQESHTLRNMEPWDLISCSQCHAHDSSIRASEVLTGSIACLIDNLKVESNGPTLIFCTGTVLLLLRLCSTSRCSDNPTMLSSNCLALKLHQKFYLACNLLLVYSRS